MLLIRHRINTLEDLASVPVSMGIELDLRDRGTRLVLQHDPFKEGIDFEEFLKHYRHAWMIVNVKSEGVEAPALELLKRYRVKDYFFLDLSFPALIKLVKKGESDIAVRFSEYEPVEQCLALAGKVRWVWVDCFQKLPLNEANDRLLKKHFKLCLVSPELQGHPKERILDFKKQLAPYSLDAVCTKYPELWQA